MSKAADNPELLRQLEADRAVLEARRLRDAGKLDQAARLIHQVVTSHPRHASALRLMAAMAMQTGASEIAIGCLSQAVAVAPRSADLLREHGEALLAGGRPAEAISAFRKALTLRPRDGAAYRGLAQAQLDAGKPADALKSFRKTLTILPYDQYAAHMIAALSGEANRQAAGYVPDLFDTYAEQFDEHLTGTLAYRVPEAIRDAVEPRLAQRPAVSMLDLGCGTGLVGTAMRDLVPAIDGIDISPRMIARAAERQLYRTLRVGDATTLLASRGPFSGPYDLVTAADVFIYIGALEAVFAAVSKVAATGGLFAFSVETVGGDKPIIRSSGRFAHPPAYIAEVSAANGFTIAEQSELPIRQERNVPIPGNLYVLVRNAT